MKPQPQPSISVGFISLGCPKNLVDAQIMAGELLSADIRLAPSPEEAEVIIVNTCAFIEEARQEAVETILAACRLKASGPCRAVLVAGCLPQRYQHALRESLPEVDAFLGLDDLSKVGRIVRRLARGERGIYSVSEKASRLFDPKHPGVIFTAGSYAYLRVAEGCNHRCAFCAIPGIRGSLRSRSVGSLVSEAERLLERGVRELALISQDVTSYGRDRKDGASLPGLLKELGGIGGRFWIRLLYSYPTRVTEALIEAMASTPQVCHYLDIPIQHSDPTILRAMRRADTIPYVNAMAERLRAAMPDVVLRTTCLVGFPGEREEHFRQLLEFVKRTEFDHLGVFTYSPEEGTPALQMPGRPGGRIASARRARLMRAQQAIVNGKAAARIGTEAEILIEGPAPGRNRVWIGRSRREAPRIDGEVYVRGLLPDTAVGTFVRVRFTAARGYDMEATAKETANG